MANYNKITESMYNAIKILLKGGAKCKEAAEYMNVTLGSVYKVNNTENYEEFLQINAEKTAKRMAAIKAKNPPQSTPITLPQHKPISGDDSYQLVQLMKKQSELLTLISNKLAFIVDELTGPTKEASV